jgi:imidazolonepropionase
MPGLKRTLWRNARLATLATADGWGWIDPGGLLTEGDRITWVGPMAELPASMPIDAEHDLGGALLTPGLIDATPTWSTAATARPNSSSACRAPATKIARAGGGIRSTVAATRAASDEQLFASAAARPQR